jgi:hypothetical protein
MVLNKSCKQLVADASEKIRTIPLQEAIKRHGDPDVVFVMPARRFARFPCRKRSSDTVILTWFLWIFATCVSCNAKA